MSKKFWKELAITLFILLVFVGVLALAGELERRDLLRENSELKKIIAPIK